MGFDCRTSSCNMLLYNLIIAVFIASCVARFPRRQSLETLEASNSSEEPKKPPKPGSQGPCCRAMQADCLACTHGMTVEQYCKSPIPKPRPDICRGQCGKRCRGRRDRCPRGQRCRLFKDKCHMTCMPAK